MAKRHSKRRYSKRKAKKASNSCCPVISVKCAMHAGKAKRVKTWNMAREEYTYSKAPTAPQKRCSVKLGSRTVLRNVDSQAAGKKVADLRKALLNKRCQAIVNE